LHAAGETPARPSSGGARTFCPDPATNHRHTSTALEEKLIGKYMSKTWRKEIKEKAWGFDQRIPSKRESAKAEKAARRKRASLQTILNRFNRLCVFFKQKHGSQLSKLHGWLHSWLHN
jgi:hypothetical protein